MLPTSTPKITTALVYQLLGIMSNQWKLNEAFPTLEFDKMLIAHGAMSNSVPADPAHPEWGARIYQRNKAKSLLNREGKNWTPPIQIVQKTHPGGQAGFGSLCIVGADDFAFHSAARRVAAPALAYRTTRQQVRKIVRDFGPEIDTSTLQVLEAIDRDAERQAYLADMARDYDAQKLALVQERLNKVRIAAGKPPVGT